MGFVLNTRNGRVFDDGKNFAKMKGLIRITDEQAKEILSGKVAPASVVAGHVEQTQDARVAEAAKKAAEAFKTAKVAEKQPPAVTVALSPEAVENLENAVQAERDAEQKAIIQSGEAFGGLSKETVTIADVVAASDDELPAFAEAVFKINAAPGDKPDDLRQRLLKIAAKVENRRAKAEKQAGKPVE